jgi:hypothetical protein
MHLQPVESALPFPHTGIGAEAVLQKKELPTRPKYTIDLYQSPLHLVNAAQCEGAHDTIEHSSIEGKLLPAECALLHRNSCVLDSLTSKLIHPRVRFNRGDLEDLCRIVGQVQPCPETDFQDAAECVSQQLMPIPGDSGTTQEEIAQAREKHARIETHDPLSRPNPDEPEA